MDSTERRQLLADLSALRAMFDAGAQTADALLLRYGGELEAEARQEVEEAACRHERREDVSGFGDSDKFICLDCGHSFEEGGPNGR